MNNTGSSGLIRTHGTIDDDRTAALREFGDGQYAIRRDLWNVVEIVDEQADERCMFVGARR